jgi:diaminopimelate epimerase
MFMVKLMQFFKYQALGNDYLVLQYDTSGLTLTQELSRRICHRNFGIGADGLLVPIPPSDHARFGVRIINPDGSDAEKSGNGLRIYARYLWDQGLVKTEPFSISTAGGPVSCEVLEGGRTITVDMGLVSFDSRKIPVRGPSREVLAEELMVAGKTVTYSAATIGNPHCVILRETVSEEEARRLGPLLEIESRFPNRTNVQFVEVLDRSRLRIEIWERGAGYTLASGSSSCAAAAVARRLGLCDPEVSVHMPGGQLQIAIADDFRARMTGPVVQVADGRLSMDFLTHLLQSHA